jgi:hypothetical protein
MLTTPQGKGEASQARKRKFQWHLDAEYFSYVSETQNTSVFLILSFRVIFSQNG